MDKFYFDASGTGMSRELRAQFSDLTNYLLAWQRGEATLDDIKGVMQHIIGLQVQPVEGHDWLENQLYLCAEYWQEPLRYDLCWPILERLLQEGALTLG